MRLSTNRSRTSMVHRRKSGRFIFRNSHNVEVGEDVPDKLMPLIRLCYNLDERGWVRE